RRHGHGLRGGRQRARHHDRAGGGAGHRARRAGADHGRHRRTVQRRELTESTMAQASGPAALLAFAEQVYPMLERYSYYQLLRVSLSADTHAIRTSYYKIATQLHPDRYQNLVDPETRDRLESIYAR